MIKIIICLLNKKKKRLIQATIKRWEQVETGSAVMKCRCWTDSVQIHWAWHVVKPDHSRLARFKSSVSPVFSCPGADAGSVGGSRFSTPSLTNVMHISLFQMTAPPRPLWFGHSVTFSQEWHMEGIVVSRLKGCVTVTLESTLSWYKKKMTQK